LHGADLVVLGIVARRTRYCDGFGNAWVDKVSVAALAAAIDETRAFKLGDKFSHLLRHDITLRNCVA
jgi:hypothetical protein